MVVIDELCRFQLEILPLMHSQVVNLTTEMLQAFTSTNANLSMHKTSQRYKRVNYSLLYLSTTGEQLSFFPLSVGLD